jgi:hypothetical protein
MKLIPESQKKKGLRVYCNGCKTEISKKCKHDKVNWRYKMVIYIPGGMGKKTGKICKAQNIDGALVELKQYREEIEFRKIIPLKTGFSLTEGVDRFLAMVHNQGDYVDERKFSTDHAKDCTRIIERFIVSLKKSGRNPNRMMLSELDIMIVKPFYNEVKIHAKGDSTKDRHTRIMRRFLNFLTNCGMYTGANFFKTIRTSNISSSPVAITDEEFDAVLSNLTEKNGWGIK